MIYDLFRLMTFAYAVSSGVDIGDGIQKANCEAGIVVGKLGTTSLLGKAVEAGQ